MLVSRDAGEVWRGPLDGDGPRLDDAGRPLRDDGRLLGCGPAWCGTFI